MIEAKTTVRAALDNKAAEMIKLINEKFVYEKNPKIGNEYGKAIVNAKEGKRQFSDLVEASAQACCIDEFKLYIEYKGSKGGIKNFWSKFAKFFNEVIDELMKNIADKIIREISEKSTQTDIEKGIRIEDEEVKLEVLRRFCGYLMWRACADFAKNAQNRREVDPDDF